MSGHCAHCDLPLGRWPVRATIEDQTLHFCCTGCALAQQITRAHGEDGALSATAVRLGLAIFFAVNLMMVGMATYVPAVYGGVDPGQVDGPLFLVLRWLAMALSAPVILLLGAPLLRAARTGWRTTDGLIVVGVAAAWGVSVVNTLRGSNIVYFDTAAMLLVLTTLGRHIEARARMEAGHAVRAVLHPDNAEVRRRRGSAVEHVRAEQLVPGDVVVIYPGEAFPTDGVVVTGIGGVDESSVTGEAAPVVREPGEGIAGGTCSVDGWFDMRVTASVADSTTARLAAMVDEASRARSQVERTADRAAAWLTPALILLALVAGVWWGVAESPARGVMVALSVLVVACPCGLGIAVPAAMWVGLRAAAKRGVIIRRAEALERLWKVRSVLFDKTGTLTDRIPAVTRIDAEPGWTATAVLGLAAALERELAHPVARAIAAESRRQRVPLPAVETARVLPGLGVEGRASGAEVGIGSIRFARDVAGIAVDAHPDDGSPVVVLRDRQLIGTIWLRERRLVSVATAVALLRGLGMRTGVVTGDVSAAALVPVPFSPAEVSAGLPPAGKVARVAAERQHGTGLVAFVGDGINDAPALAAADVGVAVGDARDLARMTADVVVLGPHAPADVAWLVHHARRVHRIVVTNLCWAFGYNAVAVAIAVAGRLDPLVAAFAMIGSSLAVLVNTRRAAGERRGEIVERSTVSLDPAARTVA